MSKEKAMLVIDTPKSCNECPCGKFDCLNKIYYCGLNKKTILIDNFFKKTLKNCPLKPMSSGGEVEETLRHFERLFETIPTEPTILKGLVTTLALDEENESYNKVKSFILSQQSKLDELKKYKDFFDKLDLHTDIVDSDYNDQCVSYECLTSYNKDIDECYIFDEILIKLYKEIKEKDFKQLCKEVKE